MEGSKQLVDETNITYADGKAVIRRVLDSGYFSQIRFNNAKLKQEKELLTAIPNTTESVQPTAYEKVLVNNVAKSLLEGEKSEEKIHDSFKV